LAGIFILLAATVKPIKPLPVSPEKDWGGETKNKDAGLHEGSSMRGLYGFWYRGF
jgi:hypothetical protein